jgi:hypothetical protein
VFKKIKKIKKHTQQQLNNLNVEANFVMKIVRKKMKNQEDFAIAEC